MVDKTFTSTRQELHRIAVHVVARARHQATGRFSLRVTPAGFGTPDFGPGGRRVRVTGGHVLVESDAPGDPRVKASALDGSSLGQLAELAEVDLTAPLDVGHDTPAIGDVDAPIAVDEGAATELGRWYGLIGEVLDRTVAALAVAGSAATLPRLWPEHFDVAIETDARPGRRVNLGGSPGDGFSPEPYCYVGPWTADRPGDESFWNAPFGAVLPLASPGPDGVAEAVEFLTSGVARLR